LSHYVSKQPYKQTLSHPTPQQKRPYGSGTSQKTDRGSPNLMTTEPDLDIPEKLRKRVCPDLLLVHDILDIWDLLELRDLNVYKLIPNLIGGILDETNRSEKRTQQCRNRS
jgi:hypothetical protein